MTKCETREARVEKVVKWILQGASMHDIGEAVAEHFPGEDCPALLASAMSDVEKAAHYDANVLLGWCIRCAMELYRRMVEIGDFPGALRAIKQVMEMRNHVQHDEEEPAAAEAGRVREDQGTIPPA